MKKILVAGAGHGGITAAVQLAKNGYDVTIIEKERREGLGGDWHDTFVRDTFEFCGLETPVDDMLPSMGATYTEPTKSTFLFAPEADTLCYMDRKVLLRHLFSECERAGVKLIFASSVDGAVCDEGGVKGLYVTKEGGTQKKIYADFVIDAAGIDSPVRMSLPEKFNVEKEISPDDRFYLYRAYFERVGEGMLDPPYRIYFLHEGKSGMDWVITDKDHIDVLVGGFRPIDEDDVKASLDDFRADMPYIGEKIVRGGQFVVLPLRRTLSQFVCRSYAAVGDSAAMIEPLSGSGITLSMKAGKLLADTVIESKGDVSVEGLWTYERLYHEQFGFSRIQSAIIKDALTEFTAEDITYALKSGIIVNKDVQTQYEEYTPQELARKIGAVIKNPVLGKKLAKAYIRISKIGAVTSSIPKTYEKFKVEEWKKRYMKL